MKKSLIFIVIMTGLLLMLGGCSTKGKAAAESELNQLMTVISNEKDTSKLQTILGDFAKNSKIEVAYAYYGRADGSFWMSPKSELPKDYRFNERPPYIEAVKNGTYKPELYLDQVTNRNIQTLAKPLMIDGKLVGVVGLDVYVD
jgi:methyl-accepting chemotaxis protein